MGERVAALERAGTSSVGGIEGEGRIAAALTWGDLTSK
jgi:hypothetical protein